MSKKKLGLSTFDLNIKFKSKEEAKKHAKSLIEFIRYNCKKRNWEAEAMICISNVKGNNTRVCYEKNGKVGRPKKVLKGFDNEDIINVDWHIHILLVSIPSYAFRDLIKNYIDKNWYKNNVKRDKINYANLKIYKKNANINKAEYFINQGEEVLFCNYCSENVIPKGYSLKDLYYAYVKYISQFVINGKKGRLALEQKYYEIKNFYFEITKEQDKKNSNEFMRKIRISKIKENYELKLEDNKVQENLSRRNRIFEEDISI